MKKLIDASGLVILLMVLTTIQSSAQCSFTGLAPGYCRNAAAVGLTANIGGGTFTGPGITGAVFDPAQAGAGTHTITYAICTSSYQVSAGTYSLINTGGTGVTLSDDDLTGALPIGFPFEFFCATYTSFAISSNGFITFDVNAGDNGCCSGQNIPDGNTPNNLVAFAWEDLDPDNGNAGTITYTTIGTQPNRIMVMTFSNVPHYPNNDPITVQVQLHESTNFVEIHTNNMPTDGGSHTMGIENSSGNSAFVVSGRNSVSWSASNEMQRFAPVNSCITSQTTTVDGTSLTVTGQNTLCLHSSITLTANGTTTYSWNIGGNSSQLTDSPIVTTTYVVTGAAPGTLNCVYSTPFVVTIFSTPVSASTSNTLLCVGNAATLTGQGASTYTWSTGAAVNTTTVNPIVTTNYTVWGTSAVGCTDQFTITQDVNTNMILMSPDTAICLGDEITLTALNVTTFMWSTNSPFSSIIESPSVTTSYSVTATDMYGCSHDGAVTVSVHPLPNVEITTPKNTVCKDQAVVFTASGAGNYQWSSNTTGSGSTVQVVPQVDLPLTVTVSGTDQNGCSDEASKTVTVDKCVGLSENTLSNQFEIFPNPSTGIFYVKNPEKQKLLSANVYNSVGAFLFNVDLAASVNEVDLSDSPAGVYFIRINAGKNMVQVSRIIKD